MSLRSHHGGRRERATFLLAIGVAVAARTAAAQQTVDAGVTGFAVKRPVLASACENGCPWGELGDYLAGAMQPLGYDIVQCRNCNLDQGPKLVSTAAYPPALGVADAFVGTTTRVNAPVDFGITSSNLLAWAYGGTYGYSTYGAFPNLRLIAKIEDPTYLLIAVKADSSITDLSQVAAQKMAVTILGGGSPISQPVLDYYGLTQDAVKSWGGTYEDAIVFGQADDPTFDILVNELASPANNPESGYWTRISQKHALRFLDPPKTVLDQLAANKALGVTEQTVKYGFLKGIGRPILTVAESGHAVFGRDDMPEQAAYDVAKAIDEQHDGLKWFIRPYSYDPRTAWSDIEVPLHPGAERYYREAGYLAGSSANACSMDASANHAASARGGCSLARSNGDSTAGRAAFALAFSLLAARRRKRPPSRRQEGAVEKVGAS